jgi:hypothetical protein
MAGQRKAKNEDKIRSSNSVSRLVFVRGFGELKQAFTQNFLSYNFRLIQGEMTCLIKQRNERELRFMNRAVSDDDDNEKNCIWKMRVSLESSPQRGIEHDE